MNITQRITEYLSSGGLFNPELAEHEKVRDLLIDSRKEIERITKRKRTKSKTTQNYVWFS